MRSSPGRVTLVSFLLLSCASRAPETAGQRAPADNASADPPPRPHATPANGSVRAEPPRPAAVYSALEPALVRCYEDGRRAVPAMTEGRITLHAAIDEGARRARCVVPSGDVGLSREVEDCMRGQLESVDFPLSTRSWTVIVAVVVREGRLAPAASSDATTAFETIESQGLPEDIYTSMDLVIPALKQCVQGFGSPDGRRRVHVGARVGREGAVECAVATTADGELPVEARACAERAFLSARMPPPKRNHGLVSVPIEIARRR